MQQRHDQNLKDSQGSMYTCPKCGYRYAEKAWAEKCEEWCEKHSSCNLEIIAHGFPPQSEN